MKLKDGSIIRYTSDCHKTIDSLRSDSLRIIKSDYTAAIKSITEAFNDKLVKYDVQLHPNIIIQLKPLQRIKELPDYGEDYRTDK